MEHVSRPRSFKQEIVALFGQPVAENPTQYMMERAFAHHRLDWRYLTLEVAPADLGDAVRGMRAMGFRGGNCTLPHKVAVVEHLDRLSDSARLIGAVNCIVRQDGKLVGENTDGQGFLRSLREVAEPLERNIVILGAGGAARAIAVELGLAGASSILIVNRHRDRGQDLARLLNERLQVPARFVPWEGDYRVPASIDILVNATPVGLYPQVTERLPLDFETLRAEMIVADVIPNPPQTELLREARRRGCRTIDGLGMLVNQGVIGFRLWTGVEPDAAVMRAALKEVLD
jgi:shikimate dehydrogenase